MLGLRFDAEGVYFCCFRQPTTTSVILSYPIPPFTTVRGLIECALGLSRNSYFLQNKLKIGIEPLNQPEKITELSRILKFVPRQKKRTYQKNFPSTPMFKSFLVNPHYRIYLAGKNELITRIAEKLQTPERPIYLGQSDDMVDIHNVISVEIDTEESSTLSSVLEGVIENCEVIKVPYSFVNKGKHVEMKVVSIPKEMPLELGEEIKCWRFDIGNIFLF